MYILGIIPVIWLSLLIAPYIRGGLAEVIKKFGEISSNPFNIIWCEYSLKTIIIALCIYILGIGMYESTRKNYRRREEYGSAKWGIVSAINKKYRQKPFCDNKILTKNLALGLDGKRHRRNLNVLVCGGSGAGKTRFYCKPNVMQCSSKFSYVILDPKRRNFKRYRKSIREKRL